MDAISNSSTQRLPTPAAPAAAPPAGREPGGNTLPAGGKDLPPPPPPVDVQRAAEQIRSYLSSNQRALQFRLDESSGRHVMTVTNPETGEIIRQIPGEEVLQMAAAIQGGGTRLLDALA